MPFLQLILDIGADDPTRFEDALFHAGATAVTLHDAADDPVLEPAPGATPLWPTITMKGLFDASADRAAILTALESEAGALPAHRFETVADRPWEREWLKDFKPMRFGERLWICPGGMTPPAELLPKARSQPPIAIVDLDPGLAFGTGTHPTTALCLEWLDSVDLHGKTVIDYGCGSGILAIAALKLGAASAIGVDIDPQALTASRDNAARNGVSERLKLCAVERELLPTDVVLANILAGPLAELAPKLARYVLPGGSIVLSGILAAQVVDVSRHYAPWFELDVSVIRDEWARITGTRRAAGSRL